MTPKGSCWCAAVCDFYTQCVLFVHAVYSVHCMFCFTHCVLFLSSECSVCALCVSVLFHTLCALFVHSVCSISHSVCSVCARCVFCLYNVCVLLHILCVLFCKRCVFCLYTLCVLFRTLCVLSVHDVCSVCTMCVFCFTDMAVERNVLAEQVFPKLRRYCRDKYGVDFPGKTAPPPTPSRTLSPTPVVPKALCPYECEKQKYPIQLTCVSNYLGSSLLYRLNEK